MVREEAETVGRSNVKMKERKKIFENPIGNLKLFGKGGGW